MFTSRVQLTRNLIPPNVRVSESFRRRVAYHLANLIAHQRRFESLADFRAFCSEPDNLRPWLPSATDRDVLASELAMVI
jgi:hypothetical protein